MLSSELVRVISMLEKYAHASHDEQYLAEYLSAALEEIYFVRYLEQKAVSQAKYNQYYYGTFAPNGQWAEHI